MTNTEITEKLKIAAFAAGMGLAAYAIVCAVIEFLWLCHGLGIMM